MNSSDNLLNAIRKALVNLGTTAPPSHKLRIKRFFVIVTTICTPELQKAVAELRKDACETDAQCLIVNMIDPVRLSHGPIETIDMGKASVIDELASPSPQPKSLDESTCDVQIISSGEW